MKKTYIIFALLLIVTGVLFFGMCQRQKAEIKEYKEQMNEQQKKINWYYEVVDRLNSHNLKLKNELDSLGKVKQQVIIKWQTKIDTIQGFSFVQTSENVSQELKSLCGAENDLKSIKIESDTLGLFDKEQMKCVLRGFLERSMYHELWTTTEKELDVCLQVVDNRDSTLFMANQIINAKDNQLYLSQKQIKNMKKNTNKWKIATAAGVILSVLLLVN